MVRFAYAIVTLESAQLFIHASKLGAQELAHLNGPGDGGTAAAGGSEGGVNIEILPYEAILEGVAALATVPAAGASCTSGGSAATVAAPVDACAAEKNARAQKQVSPGLVWLAPSSCNYALYSVLPKEQLLLQASPVEQAKVTWWCAVITLPGASLIPSFIFILRVQSIKNDSELQGMRNAHVRDAVAVVTFFHWLEERVACGDGTPCPLCAP
jgi:hypothetical protein